MLGSIKGEIGHDEVAKTSQGTLPRTCVTLMAKTGATLTTALSTPTLETRVIPSKATCARGIQIYSQERGDYPTFVGEPAEQDGNAEYSVVFTSLKRLSVVNQVIY